MFKSVLFLSILAFAAYADCPNGTFDGASYCNSCASNDACDSCMNDMDFYLDEGSCCPYNYAVGTSGDCEICPSYCIGCENPDSFICTGCHPEMYFSNGVGPGECVPLQVYDYGTQPDLICAQGYFLYGNHMCLVDENWSGEPAAYDYCIDGYFYNYEQERCVLCMENLDQEYENACILCGNRGTEEDTEYGCDCCINDYFPVGPYGHCCPFNYRYEATDPTGCATCHPTCAQCQGPTEYDCTTCFNGTFFIDDVSPGQCSVNTGDYQGFQCAEGWTLFKEYLCINDEWEYIEDINAVCDSSFGNGNGGDDGGSAELLPTGYSAETHITGCMNPAALNYNSEATMDDDSCEWDQNICHPDFVEESEFIIFCSECGYTGNMLILDEDQECLDWPPQSIHVPRGKQVQVFDLCQYDGQDAIFGTSVECVGLIDFSLLLNNGITLAGKKSNLKANSSPSSGYKYKVL